MPNDQEIDRHLANLRERFGAKLTDEQAAVVRERVAAALQAGEDMRAVSLDNADEPFTTFTPFIQRRADARESSPSSAGENERGRVD